ncbi:MAG TPA: phosphatidylglycerol lysyltransferase domain-containing protein [Methanosarcina sp.]|nr:phosphatidylglycerol lysyltransferase domain-containing protein [Methanosarcina sp.]
MLGQEDFKPVTLADRAFFESHYSLYPQTHSSNTFTNMVCWNHFTQYQYAYVNGNVIISSTVSGVTQFRPPIGPRDPELMRSLLRLALDVGGNTSLTLIDPDTVQWIQEIDSDLVMVPDLNHFEYVYRASDLMELPGRNYRKIRSQINRFRKNYRYTVEIITPGNRKEVEEFFVKWCEHKGCKNNPALEKEIEAVFYAIEHFTELSLRGILIRIDSQVCAISLFERLNADTALIHFEKGLPEYEGIYKAINMYTAAVLANEVEYINRESDLGISGLREAKMRYHPHHMVEVYSLKR